MKLTKKLIASILTLTMLMGYLSTLKSAVIASSANLTGQNSKTNHANIEMNSYFEGENHSQTFETGKEAKVFFRVKISNTGYLKNTTIKLINSNYEFITKELKNAQVQSITSDEIKLKQISAIDEELILEVPIQILKSDKVSENLFDSISKVKMTGTYIDENGKEKQIEKEINQQVKWNTSAEAELAGEISKYIPYHIDNEYGVIMQAKISSNIKNNEVPVKNTKLEVSLPEINVAEKTIKPTRVSVVANTTIATNGKNNGDSFNTENYHYDEEKNIIIIETKNEADNEGKIAWNQGKDEYLITYTFVGKEAYNAINNKGDISVKAILETYQEGKIVEKQGKIAYNIEEKLGDIVDFNISNTSSISKGYIYANYAKQEAKKENKNKTTYEQTYYAQIYDEALSNKIEFQTNTEKLLNNEKETSVGKNINTQKIIIAENIFQKMLGAEGKIEITDLKGNKLGIIDATTQNTDGNYILDISEKNINEIIIKTSKPVSEGKLAIKVEKAFATDQTYTKAEMQKFSKMTIGVTCKTNTNTANMQKEVTLTEPVSKAEISIGEGKQNLSAVLPNKDVNIRVVLDTSKIENALYKNPVIEIQMPKQIKKIDIKSANLLLDEELKIKETKVVTQNGRQIIQIILKGTQTEYYGAHETNQKNVIAKGANIVLKADITLNPLSASKTEEVVMYYTNENTNLYEQTYNQKTKARTAKTQTIGMTKTGITIIGQNEVVTASGISNYATGKEDILSATEGTSKATLQPYTDKKISTISGKIINNYANNIKDVVILGRFPSKDNQKIDTTENFGSTFSTSLVGEITLKGISADKYQIYYSNKVDANKDLSDNSNGWSTQSSSESKSYMIVLSKDYELPSETEIDFNYQAQIPQNLSYNQSSYTMYKIYYTNISETGTKSESKISHIIELTTGTGPNIQINLKSATTTVREGQIVKMTATIKNTGTIKAENAKLLITAPEGTVHTEILTGTLYYTDSTDKEKVINLGNINPGDTIVKTYELKIKKGVTVTTIHDEEDGDIVVEENKYPGDKDIQNIVRISASNMTSEIKSEPYIIRILKGDLSIENIPDPNQTEILKEGRIVRYTVKLKNISYDTDLNNTTLKVTLPSGVKIKQVYYANDKKFTEKITQGVTINGQNISVNVGKLQSFELYSKNNIENSETGEKKDNILQTPQEIQLREEAYVYIEFEVQGFSGEYDCIMSATADNLPEHYSNNIKLLAEKVQLKFEQKELEKQYVKEGKEYTYHFVISNIGKISSTSNKMEMTLPEGITFVKAEYTIPSGSKKVLSKAKDGHFTISIYELEPGKSIDITVTVKANLLPDKNDKTVTTVATLEATGFEKIESNKVNAIIEYDENAHQTDGKPNEPSTSTYKITGTAWLDKNKDGQKENEEELLENIQVLLIHKSNSKLVASTNTDNKGKYEFNNINKGEYLVVFLYDASKYDITAYKKEGIGESYNSDATNMKIVLDGEQRYAGVTDTIKISNNNIRDIDIGLYISEKFDLRLDKYISKVTVTTPSDGSKVYNYNNSKLTKREIYGKDVGKSNIVVEYKIVVTNEGQIDGYAKKLIDYLPQEAKFNTELNKDWYLSKENGAVYNSSLANEKIMPGQSKEVKLILSYSITEKNIGKLLNNNAEIYESYNEQGLNDMDSNPANKLESEDDMSAADMIISLATGKIVLYVSLTIAVIVLLGFGIFEIKKRVLNKKEN